MKYASDFLAYSMNVRGFTEATATTYGSALRDLALTIEQDDPTKIGLPELELYMTRKALSGTATSTRRARGHAIKSFFRWLTLHGHIPVDPTVDFRPPDESVIAISTLTPDEIQRLVFYQPLVPVRGRRENEVFFRARVKAQRVADLRDSALIGLSYCVGLRAGEIADLTIGSLTHDEKGRTFISLRGKGARESKMYLVDAQVSRLIDEYLLVRREEGLDHPSLFGPCGHREIESAKGIGHDRVSRILTARMKHAGIRAGSRKVTPHIMRYSRATHMHEAKMPLAEISAFLRHKSIQTTMRYIATGSAAAINRNANSKLPWNRPMGAK